MANLGAITMTATTSCTDTISPGDSAYDNARAAEDLERLREYGFDDLAILKATEIAALFNLVNRMISGLGVKLEDGVAGWEFGAPR